MKLHRIALIALLPVFWTSPILAQDDCDFTAPRSAVVPGAGAGGAVIEAAAGSLRIEGVRGLSEVRVRGRACASSREILEDIQLVAVREGDRIRVEARMPEWDDRRSDRYTARLDLVIQVPERLSLDVRDSSGATEIRNVAALDLQDSSGDVEIAGVSGDLRVRDSSGDLRVRGVRGTVRATDSSGDMELREVGGSVLIPSDSSGDIVVSDVAADVRIDRDSSGDIRVSEVEGDFVVERDGSGSIRSENVRGQVLVP